MTIPDNREGLTGQAIEHQEQDLTGNTDARLGQAVQAEWQRALHSDQYETASQALGEVTALRNWRSRAGRSSFSPFYNLAETATQLNQVGASDEVREEVADRLTPMAQSLSPRVRDLYMGLVSRIDGRPYIPQYPMTEKQLANLTDSGDLALLEDPRVPWNLKINRMETRVESELRGRKALDRREKEEKVEKEEDSKDVPLYSTPSPDRDQSKPGMDEMERLKEGEEASAIWSIKPAYGGYYKEQSFNVWDSKTNTWRRATSETRPANLPRNRTDEEAQIAISAYVPNGQLTRVPTPYTYKIAEVRPESSTPVSIVNDKNGDKLIQINGRTTQPHFTTVYMIKKDDPTVSENPPSGSLDFPASLSEATEAEVTRIGEATRTNIQKARSLASFTMRHLIYSNDSSYNVLYEGHPSGYIGAIDQFKKADCDVANTYFAALCSRLGIPVRHVVGHMVKGKDSQGNARITSGTGHAWTEVWDDKINSWVRVDATPPGDPQMEDQQQKGNGIPGDYGGQEAIGPTDEELAALHEKLSSLTEALSYTQEERELSETTGVELKDARKIIKEIQEAENTRLPNGEKVVDVMSQLWSLIAQSRTIAKQQYTGPLRKREGGEEIDDIIAHKIGVKAGETDPASRQKEHVETQTERIIRKLQARIVGDKSGSMSDTVDGEAKWELQRRSMYLVLSSLDRAQRNLQRESSRLIEPLSIETQVISFRNKSTIDVDKPLSTEFSLEDKVRLWHSLGDQGVGNGDVAALSQLYEEISEEVEGQQDQEDDALRIIIACSDGEPDDPARVHQLAQALGELNTLVIGIGLTETAAKVPIIFDTPFSRGDLARDINDLPAILARHVVMEAIKLFPKDSLQGYQRTIDNILAKFDRVGVI